LSILKKFRTLPATGKIQKWVKKSGWQEFNPAVPFRRRGGLSGYIKLIS
jgi:hypothetical protein